MKKENVEKSIPIEDESLKGPAMPSMGDVDTINVDSLPRIPEEFIGENFDSLINIFKTLNSPTNKGRVRIDYADNNGQKTASVFIDNKRCYFTESAKEIENFHNWQENQKKRLAAKNRTLD